MKQYRASLFALLFPCLSCVAASELAPPTTTMPSVPINSVAAVINESIVTERDLNQEIREAKSQYLQHHMPIPSDKELRAKILDNVIAKRLMLQIAVQNHIEATDKEFDETVQNIAKQSHLTLEQLKQKLAAEHITYARFKKQIKEQIVLTKIQQQAVNGRIDITPEKLAKFKEKLASQQSVTEYHVVDYLVELSDDASASQKEAARATATQLSARLHQGKQVDTQITRNDLEWQPLDGMPDLFVTSVAKMRQGDVSAPLLAPNGYHVLTLEATRQTGRTVDDEQARELLYQEQYQTVLKNWVKNLRDNSYVRVY